MALPAGTYLFKLADVNDPQVIEVFSRDGKTIYGTFLTNPEQRPESSDQAAATFDETPTGTPEAIKAWFYGDRATGHAFIYSGHQEARLAQASGQVS